MKSLGVTNRDKRRPKRVLIPDPFCVKGGVEEFACSMLPEFSSAGDWEVIWMVPRHRRQDLVNRIGGEPNLCFADSEWPSTNILRWIDSTCRRGTTLTSARILESIRLHLLERRVRHLARRADVILYLWTLGVRRPKLPLPVVSVLLDLNWRHFPENFPGQSPAALDAASATWVRSSAQTITISNSIAQELASLTPDLPSSTRVVPLATGTNSIKRANGLAEASQTRRILYPATVSAHKNHVTLLLALRRLKELGRDVSLVLSGSGSSDVLDRIPDPNGRSWDDVRSSVCGLGYVSRAQLEEEYRRAAMVVLPSRYEGFGLPLVEALARGIPVIHSSIPPFLEQIDWYKAEDQAISVEPNDSAAFANAIVTVLDRGGTDDHKALLWSKRVRERWSWTHVARAYCDILDKVHHDTRAREGNAPTL